MALRTGLVVLRIASVLAVCGCRSTGSRSGGTDRETSVRESPRNLEIIDLRSEARPEASEALYERAVSLATTSEEKARAYVSLGRAQLNLGRAQDALKSFYEARRLAASVGSLSPMIHQALGDAYFDIADYSLARRYLGRAADEGVAANRDVLFAKLVLCCRAMADVSAATAYRNKLKQPISEEARSILASEDWLSRSYNGMGSPREPAALRQAPRATPAVARSDAADKLRVYSRTSWSARAPRPNIEAMGQVDKITVHHSGGDNIWSSSASDTAEEIRKIQRYHQNDKGWADIGYHYVIDRSGAIWQGRKLRYQGAHARGAANEGNVGIVLLGNYMHQRVTSAQRDSLETLIETLCEHFTIPASRVYTHGEILDGKTDCPGPEISRCLNEIRATLRRRLVAYKP